MNARDYLHAHRRAATPLAEFAAGLLFLSESAPGRFQLCRVNVSAQAKRAKGIEFPFRIYFRLQPEEIQYLGNGPPTLVAMHGSCVLERALVYRIMSSLRECDGVIVTCSSDAEIIKSFGHDPLPAIVVLPLGTEIMARAESPKTLLRAVLSLQENTKIITFVGRLIPDKNAHIFLCSC